MCIRDSPNMALMTYETGAFSANLPVFTVTDGVLVEQGRSLFRVDQPYQIAVLTDFCNECGNCVTACPTSGKPYEDKPRLYLDRKEFDAESSNAFMVKNDSDATVVLARFACLLYTSPSPRDRTRSRMP